ncbi:AIPR family protein [Salinimonas sediminis]|uniref:Abortive phage resistance protein n=1 Tax=Salinimonas sediminis TaxID=2303538 RepID=A0A346NRV3_9ALTE|nr:AIPR family protein [Salinimonas sediminis]AXR08260.1 abortive phage resistance protein [Salinimonas sediminis]
MANINDFKLLGLKCNTYFQAMNNNFKFKVNEGIDQERLGFYFFTLDNLFGISEPGDLVQFITDTEFNKLMEGNAHDDCGIDAVFIDEESKNINLFNFKYRSKYSVDSKQSLNDVITSSKYINAIYSSDVSELAGKPKLFAEQIKELYDSKEVWKTKLYIVSNDSKPVDVNDKHIKNLTQGYDIEIIPVSLEELNGFMSIRPEPINSTLILPNDALMSYSENTLATARSYIARLKSSELIRITCDDEKLREKYDLEDYDKLKSVKLDYAVLFDNVRGFVIKSKYNDNIYKSLEEHPEKFFMYNNGITIVAEKIEAEPVNGQTQMKLSMSNFQVLNGGQTLRTIHNFNEDNERNIQDYLSKSEVLVRIFQIKRDSGEVNKIAEYTNSQNTISPPDLKSLNEKQLELENFLKEKGINYIRKSGDLGKSDRKYAFSISMVKFGQLLYSLKGYPEKAISVKQSIFGKKYNEVFPDDRSYLDDAFNIIKDYMDIKKIYEDTSYESLDIKHYYMIYLDAKYPEISRIDKVDLIEKFILDYQVEKETTDVRKMTQTRFKDELIDKIESELA